MTTNIDEVAFKYLKGLREKHGMADYYSFVVFDKGVMDCYKSSYTRAIADVVEWFKSLDCACCEFCEQSSEVCFSQEIAEKIENKFLKGEK